MKLSAQAGRLVRTRRVAAGLAQSDLAGAARVSRTVLSKIEQCEGAPVQTDVLDRLLEALHVRAEIADRDPQAGRRLARLELALRKESLRSRHLRLAAVLDSRPHSRAMIRSARQQVALWRVRRSCSPLYIEKWERILSLPPRRMAAEMANLGEWEDALFQNSPWSFA